MVEACSGLGRRTKAGIADARQSLNHEQAAAIDAALGAAALTVLAQRPTGGRYGAILRGIPRRGNPG